MSSLAMLERFWRKVEVVDSDGCWNWIASKNAWGYGTFGTRSSGVNYLAHRLAYQLATTEPIPDGLWVLHACDNPACVNPAHLSLGTAQDNVDDKMRRKRHWVHRRTHCRNGHPWIPENVLQFKSQKACRMCHLVRGDKARRNRPSVKRPRGPYKARRQLAETLKSQTDG